VNKAALTVRAAVVGLVAACLLAGTNQSSFGDTAFPSVTIDEPQNGARLGFAVADEFDGRYTYNTTVGVDAVANGSDEDPPARVRLFIDKQKKPTATVACENTSTCGVQWAWNGQHLFGWHTITAEADMSDPLQPAVRSDPVRVFWKGRTHVVPHRDRHAVFHQPMIESGRVLNFSAGHRPAPHALVKVVVQAARHRHTLKVRTNAHGYYRAKFRATTDAQVTVSVANSARYLANARQYYQPVQARPRCGLSKHHVRVNKTVVLACSYPHLPVNSKFHVQQRIHGHWYQGKGFLVTHTGRTRIYITPFKRQTLVLREWFDQTAIWAPSVSNSVRLHVR